MKIFISHSSRDASFAREVSRQLPKHMNVWIDEQDLLVGSDLSSSIEIAIRDEVDYLVMLFSRNSIQSDWVERELSWALEQERRLGRVFIVPVLLDEVSSEIQPIEFRKRLYLKCLDHTESQVETLANSLYKQIIKLLLTRIKDISKKELQFASLLAALSELVKSMTDDERWLLHMITLKPGKGLKLPKSFARDSEFHSTLRSLRDRNLIQPAQRGRWQGEKHATMTEIGRAIAQCEFLAAQMFDEKAPIWKDQLSQGIDE